MKFVLHKDSVQLLPETALDVEILEGWENSDFRAHDMTIIAGASGVRRYPSGLIIRKK
jgi:hypothetical protein